MIIPAPEVRAQMSLLLLLSSAFSPCLSQSKTVTLPAASQLHEDQGKNNRRKERGYLCLLKMNMGGEQTPHLRPGGFELHLSLQQTERRHQELDPEVVHVMLAHNALVRVSSEVYP